MDLGVSGFAIATLVGLFIFYYVAKSLNIINGWKKNSAFLEANGVPVLEDKHWLLGHIHLAEGAGPNQRFIYHVMRQARKLGGVVHICIGPRPIVYCCEPKSVKALLSTNEPKLDAEGVGPYENLLPWLGYGLLLSSGDKWRRNRRLLTPAFHFNILKPYMRVNNEAADILLNKLDTLRKSGSVEICEPVSLCTLDVILRCAFSYEDDVQEKGENHPYVLTVKAIAHQIYEILFSLTGSLPYVQEYTPLFRRYAANAKKTHKFTESLIRKRKKSLQEDPKQIEKRYLDFLDILLTARDEEGKGLSDLEIRDEADTFLFEGHDTTASAVAWVLYSLAGHPEHQQRCQEEIDQILKGRPSDHLEWDDMSKLPFTTMCIKEAMRLHSPVPFVGRVLTKHLDLGGKTVPPGVYTFVNIFAAHRNPEVWGEDSDEYNPQRFSPENSEKRDSHAFVPFSAGSRNCIGQNFAMNEEKVLISRILHRFTMTLDKSHEVEYLAELVMRSKNGIKIHFSPRQAA